MNLATLPSEGEVARAIARGDLNLTGVLLQMYRQDASKVDQVMAELRHAHAQLPEASKQVLRHFAAQLNQVIRNA